MSVSSLCSVSAVRACERARCAPGSWYAHFKSNTLYRVLAIGNCAKTKRDYILYMAADRIPWCRETKDFLSLVDCVGRKIPRFTLISTAVRSKYGHLGIFGDGDVLSLCCINEADEALVEVVREQDGIIFRRLSHNLVVEKYGAPFHLPVNRRELASFLSSQVLRRGSAGKSSG